MNEARVDLQEKIRQGRVTVAIIGLGYVGLPLAVGFARAGVRVRGIDVSLDRVARINAGVSYIPDVPTEVLAPLVAAGTLRADTAFQQCAGADATVICVPTPFNRMKPDLSYIEAASQSLAPHVAPGALVVLQSTTYPGTTEELVRPILEATGRQVGRDYLLAFSPERIDPGSQHFSAHNTPKVVGGVDEASREAAAALFGILVSPDQIHRVSIPRCRDVLASGEHLPEREHRPGERAR